MVEKSKPTAAAERLESLPKRPGKASFAITILRQGNYPSLKVLLAAMIQLNFLTLCCWELLCHVQRISSLFTGSLFGETVKPPSLSSRFFTLSPNREPFHRQVHFEE